MKNIPCELTNMVMVENPETGKVLVQKRIKYWTGISFPGGHIEKGESFTESAIREVKEETGLDIINPKLCGMVHWCKKDSDERYIVVLYKTNQFSGELINETEEGKIFWIDKSDIGKYELSPNFNRYLELFFGDNNEFFCCYSEDETEADYNIQIF